FMLQASPSSHRHPMFAECVFIVMKHHVTILLSLIELENLERTNAKCVRNRTLIARRRKASRAANIAASRFTQRIDYVLIVEHQFP
ncbi:MAG: hypothetical protein ACXABL_12270, partial [Candidatus Thorarchaeota archaeon]